MKKVKIEIKPKKAAKEPKPAKLKPAGEKPKTKPAKEKKSAEEPQWIEIETLHGLFKTGSVPRKFQGRGPWVPENKKEVTAYIPGTVVEVYVKPGDVVAVGDPLLLFNTMKMNNTFRAVAAGKVMRVNIAVGDKFPKGFLLIELA